MTRDYGKMMQLAFSVLLLTCIAQAVYWIGDNVYYTTEVASQLESMANALPEYAQKQAELLEIRSQSEARINRYIWEGAFFLVVLSIGLVLIWRAVREDFELRKRQQNFVSAVSHELRSPVASIRLAAELLIKDGQSESAVRIGNRVKKDTDRLIRQIDNLLNVSRIEDVRWDLAPQHVGLRSLAETVVAQFEGRSQELGVAIKCDIEPSISVWMDPTALEIVVRNLLDNALSACSVAGGKLVWILADIRDARVTLLVRDEGVGFASTEAKKIFEKFYRVGDELRRRTPGTGLGLYLVKRLCELSRVEVIAHSDGIGRGAEVRLVFPPRGIE